MDNCDEMSLLNDINFKFDYGEKISINNLKVKELIQFHKNNDMFTNYEPYDWSDNRFWLENENYTPEEISNFFTIGNSINFKFWDLKNSGIIYCKGKKKGEKIKGAKYMWRCLKVAVEENIFPILNPKELIKINEKDFDNIFRDDEGRLPLFMSKKERITNLIDLGDKLIKNWDNCFLNLFTSTKGSLIEYVKECKKFRAFDDKLLKLSMVNAILHTGRGLYKFDRPLIPGIDYQLMKQMIRINAITPSEKIEKKLKEKKILEADEALELRYATLYVFNEIMKETNIPGEVIDNKWWMNKEICLDINPKCDSCQFNNLCDKKTDLHFPLENTRYY